MPAHVDARARSAWSCQCADRLCSSSPLMCIGFLGQSYQIHGAADEHFSIISASDIQLNARFDYLATGAGKCTYTHTPCFAHPGDTTSKHTQHTHRHRHTTAHTQHTALPAQHPCLFLLLTPSVCCACVSRNILRRIRCPRAHQQHHRTSCRAGLSFPRTRSLAHHRWGGVPIHASHTSGSRCRCGDHMACIRSYHTTHTTGGVVIHQQ